MEPSSLGFVLKKKATQTIALTVTYRSHPPYINLGTMHSLGVNGADSKFNSEQARARARSILWKLDCRILPSLTLVRDAS